MDWDSAASGAGQCCEASAARPCLESISRGHSAVGGEPSDSFLLSTSVSGGAVASPQARDRSACSDQADEAADAKAWSEVDGKVEKLDGECTFPFSLTAEQVQRHSAPGSSEGGSASEQTQDFDVTYLPPESSLKTHALKLGFHSVGSEAEVATQQSRNPSRTLGERTCVTNATVGRSMVAATPLIARDLEAAFDAVQANECSSSQEFARSGNVAAGIHLGSTIDSCTAIGPASPSAMSAGCFSSSGAQTSQTDCTEDVLRAAQVNSSSDAEGTLACSATTNGPADDDAADAGAKHMPRCQSMAKFIQTALQSNAVDDRKLLSAHPVEHDNGEQDQYSRREFERLKTTVEAIGWALRSAQRRNLSVRQLFTEQRLDLHKLYSHPEAAQAFAGMSWTHAIKDVDTIRQSELRETGQHILAATKWHPSGDVFLGACDPCAFSRDVSCWSRHDQQNACVNTGRDQNDARKDCNGDGAPDDQNIGSFDSGASEQDEASTVLFSDAGEPQDQKQIDAAPCAAGRSADRGRQWSLGPIVENVETGDEDGGVATCHSPGAQCSRDVLQRRDVLSDSELAALRAQVDEVALSHCSPCREQDCSSARKFQNVRKRLATAAILAPLIRLSGERLACVMEALWAHRACEALAQCHCLEAVSAQHGIGEVVDSRRCVRPSLKQTNTLNFTAQSLDGELLSLHCEAILASGSKHCPQDETEVTPLPLRTPAGFLRQSTSDDPFHTPGCYNQPVGSSVDRETVSSKLGVQATAPTSDIRKQSNLGDSIDCELLSRHCDVVLAMDSHMATAPQAEQKQPARHFDGCSNEAVEFAIHGADTVAEDGSQAPDTPDPETPTLSRREGLSVTPPKNDAPIHIGTEEIQSLGVALQMYSVVDQDAAVLCLQAHVRRFRAQAQLEQLREIDRDSPNGRRVCSVPRLRMEVVHSRLRKESAEEVGSAPDEATCKKMFVHPDADGRNRSLPVRESTRTQQIAERQSTIRSVFLAQRSSSEIVYVGSCSVETVCSSPYSAPAIQYGGVGRRVGNLPAAQRAPVPCGSRRQQSVQGSRCRRPGQSSIGASKPLAAADSGSARSARRCAASPAARATGSVEEKLARCPAEQLLATRPIMSGRAPVARTRSSSGPQPQRAALQGLHWQRC